MKTIPELQLSVVIAVWGDIGALDLCLAALAPQIDDSTQILAVSTLSSPPPAIVERHPWLEWHEAPPECLIPHLWARGIAHARGRLVALTTAHFEPDDDWLCRLRDAHRRLDSVGIGGSIAPPRGGSLVDWATYFLRYSAYFEYRREQAVDDLAADNACYRRAALTAHLATLPDGFWEPDFHRRVLAEGETLSYIPEIRVRQRASFGVWRFCVQRRRHGRQFGQTRMRDQGWAPRLAGAFGSPLIPLILLAKVARRVWRSGRDFAPFLASLPILLLFTIAWALGEARGYLTPP